MKATKLMKEILFRAKRIDNGEWIKGIAFPYDDGKCAILCRDPVDGTLKGEEVDPETVCQYSGRNCYDKEGHLHRIFEKDICDVVIFNDFTGEQHYTYEVTCVNGSFCLISGYFFTWLGDVEDTESDLTWIGNEFDNPELLKEIRGGEE